MSLDSLETDFPLTFSETIETGGTTDHNQLINRGLANQHPISAITGLEEALVIASPTVTVETITGGHQVTITDKEGEHEFNVMDGLNGSDGVDGKDGSDGKDGKDGTNGQDGYSPIVSITAITDGHAITITDASGDHTFDVFDGADGQDGSPGQNGADGKDGKDGSDYVITQADYNAISQIVLGLLPIYAGGTSDYDFYDGTVISGGTGA